MIKPGDIGLLHMDGPVGFGIRVGEWINGDGFKDLEHAVVVTSVYDDWVSTMSAQPGGARPVSLRTSDALWLAPRETMGMRQQLQVVRAAFDCKGTPYSFLDYSAIALHRVGVPAPGLRDYIANSKHMICSQMVDWCYQQAGIQLFDDGRWNGYVTPLDLWKLYPQGKLVQAA